MGGEDTILTGRSELFFGWGLRREDEPLEGEIEECFRGRREFVDGNIVDAWQWLLLALVWDERRSSVETLFCSCEKDETVSSPWEEDTAKEWRCPVSALMWDKRRSSV